MTIPNLRDNQVEAAARAYCRILDINPDQMQTGADENHPTLGVTKPLWQWVVPEVKRAHAMLQALDEVKDS